MSATPAFPMEGAPKPLAPELTARPKLKEQLSYVGGEFASNFAWNMVAGFLLFYYTDVALLPVAALGTLMLMSRVLDAIVDPFVGIVVDRTRTRWGQARPYLLFAAIPFAVLCVMTFTVPDWSPSAKVAYGYATFILLGIFYSLVYIPYGALQPMMVRDPTLKVRIGSWRSMATSVASIVVYSVVLPLVALFGPDNKRAGFTFAAAIVALITVALYLNVFFQCRERFTASASTASRPVGQDLARLFRNPVWVFIVSYAFLAFVRIGVMVSVTAYMTNNVLGSPWMLGVVLPMLSVAIFTGGLIAGPLINRFGQRSVNVVALLVSIGLYLLMPQFEQHAAAFITVFTLANVGGGVLGATIFINCTDAVEFNEKRFGDRNEGLLFASVSFGMKVGMAVGAAATAYALSWAGYDPHAQSARSAAVIRDLFYYAAVAIMVLQILCVVALGGKRALSAFNEGSAHV
jgi:GPH family glycoside/pentoside/hexuronide:cation symporter